MADKKRWLVIATRYDSDYLKTVNFSEATLETLLRGGFIPFLALIDPALLDKDMVSNIESTQDRSLYLENLSFEKLSQIAEMFDPQKGLPPGVELTSIRRLVFRGKVELSSTSPSSSSPSGN